jgi:hypothetical protein
MSNRRALILFPGALGDFVCFLPTLKILAERTSIDLLARTEFSEIVAGRVKVGSLERFEIGHLFVSGGGSDDKQLLRGWSDYFNSIRGSRGCTKRIIISRAFKPIRF